jgi:tRNA(adenine34) deaminase
MNLLEDSRFNHNPKLYPGLLADECGALLSGFFRRIREDASQPPKPGPHRN